MGHEEGRGGLKGDEGCCRPRLGGLGDIVYAMITRYLGDMSREDWDILCMRNGKRFSITRY